MVSTPEGFLDVAIESWPEWDMNPRPLNSVQRLLYHSRLTSPTGDIGLNLGPKPSFFKYFSTCRWNLNRIEIHDFLKVKLFNSL